MDDFPWVETQQISQLGKPTSTLPAGGVAVPVVRHGVLIANPSLQLCEKYRTAQNCIMGICKENDM